VKETKEKEEKMKQVSQFFLLIFIIFYTSNLVSQNLLNLPESVEYDPFNNRYLVSNWGSGDIVQIDSLGNQSVWLDYVQGFAGLHRKDNILYVACREYGVKGFDLMTGENVLYVDIEGATNINDIVSDNSGNLYVSSPAGNVIYKINIASGQWWVFAENSLSVPNGLYFDEDNNRLILVSYRMNAPIQQVSLIDSTVSLVTYPGLHNLDGITRDHEGNYYVSSWYSNAVFKLDENFSNPPEMFSIHDDDPADIFFDTANNMLAVPLFYTHHVVFVPGIANDIQNEFVYETPEIQCFGNFPNPFNLQTDISFNLTKKAEVTLSIYDITGRLIDQILKNVELDFGKHTINWSNQNIPSGHYLYLIETPNNKIAHKMLIIK